MTNDETIDRADVEVALVKVVEDLLLRARVAERVAATSGDQGAKDRLHGKADGYRDSADRVETLQKWIGPVEAF